MNKIGVKEFAGKLAVIAMDSFSVALLIGEQSLEKQNEERILDDAMVLQWYATQNFMGIKCTQQNMVGDVQARMACAFNEAWFGLFENLPDGADRKLKRLMKAQEQRPQYDKLLSSGGARNFLDFDFLSDMGQTFARMTKSENSMHYNRIVDLGRTIYKKALTRCLNEFNDSSIEVDP
jgi:hypothetical protein